MYLYLQDKQMNPWGGAYIVPLSVYLAQNADLLGSFRDITAGVMSW